MEQVKREIPLLFTFRERVLVGGTFVEVIAKGRALAWQDRDDDEPWWFVGVNPGALAASGSTPGSAHAEFRLAFRNVLVDFAQEARDVEGFTRVAKAFFEQVAEEKNAQWCTAVQEIRAGKLEDVGLEKKPADDPRGIEVRVLGASNNSEFLEPLATAA